MYLAEFALVSVNSIFGQMLLLFTRGLLFWSPILTLTPLNRAWLQWSLVWQSCQMLRGHTCGAKKLWGNLKIINMSAQKPMFLASLLFVILQRLECCISIPHNSVPSDFCSTYHRQPSVCFTEASRSESNLFVKPQGENRIKINLFN